MVETKQRLLYFTLPDRKAMRYGVALGDESFGWTGEAVVERKAEWPDWNPPAEMTAALAARPHDAGRPATTRSAPARSICSPATRTRSTASTAPTSRRRSVARVSSGCIRMRNIDVIDLYNRVQVGTRVIVR